MEFRILKMRYLVEVVNLFLWRIAWSSWEWRQYPWLTTRGQYVNKQTKRGADEHKMSSSFT